MQKAIEKNIKGSNMLALKFNSNVMAPRLKTIHVGCLGMRPNQHSKIITSYWARSCKAECSTRDLKVASSIMAHGIFLVRGNALSLTLTELYGL